MRRTILIVDDQKINRTILTSALSENYSVREASGGEEALAVLAREQGSISAVLLDISMPGMDGYEVLTRIREDRQLATTPVIMITGSEDEASRVKSLALGANDYVMKPYNPDVIKHCLKNNIAYHEAAETVSALQRDKLTGLFTRETFFDKARTMVAEHEPGYYVMSCIDIDNFKVINDQYGTELGDDVLVCLANNLKRDCDTDGSICGRIAADNFAVLYKTRFLEERTVNQRDHVEAIMADSPVSFVISIGRYIVGDKSLSVSAMYDRAVLARKTIKGRADVHVALFDETMRSSVIREQEIVSEMRSALENRQFEVWFQPQYNHATGAMIGAEALVRWSHPQKGLVPPCDFIPVFEKNGFIYDLDKFVWEEVCRCLRGWLDEGRNPLPVSVNISRYDILRPDLTEVISGLTKKYRLPLDLFRLEITESAFSESAQRIVSVVKELIHLGFTVEIDDFGSGYSSLNTLKDVPAQILKLDMKFFASSDDSGRGGNIVESVVRMAKWLGMSVIAEGVETIEQADYLKSIGCNYIQGYLYARPMPTGKYEVHCEGIGKEERLLALETAENMDSNAFWDPDSMDSLIFNSYVGAACIFEYKDDKIEVIRSTEKFASMISGNSMSVEDTLRLDWSAHLDDENKSMLCEALVKSKQTSADVTVELLFIELPGCPAKTYVRATLRVVATAGNRYLVYNLVENITERREAEQKQNETAQRLQTIMSNAGTGIRAMIMDGDNVEYLFSNDRFYELQGYTREQYESEVSDSYGVIHPVDRAWIKNELQNTVHVGDIKKLEFRIVARDGGIRWLRAVVSVTNFDGVENPVQLCIYTDVTEIVEANKRETEAQRALLDNMPYGAALYEYDGKKLTAVHLNKKYWELVERQPDEENKLSFINAVHPDDRARIFSEVSAAIEQKRAININLRIRCGESGYKPFRITANMESTDKGYLIYAAYELINEDTLSYQQALPLLLSAVMNSTNDFAFAKDKEFRYLSVSRAFIRLAGLNDESDAVGKTDYELFPVGMAEQFRQNDIALLESGKSLVDYDETVYDPDGTTHYCRASKYPLRDASGRIVGLYGVSRDITNERSALEQLKLVNDTVPGGIATYSIQNGLLRITYCNDGFCDLFDGTLESFRKRGPIDPMDWVVEADRNGLQKQIDALVKDNKPVDHVYRIRTVTGQTKWINHKATVAERHGDTVVFNSLLLDVTERQSFTEQLRISEQENALAVQHSGNVVCRYNVAEKTLTMSEESAQALHIPPVLTGVPEEPVRLGLISPATSAAYTGFFEAIQKGDQAGTVLFQQKYLGDWRWEEARSSTVFADDGTPVKAIISMSDVTDRIEKENIYKKWQQSLTDRAPESYTLFRCNLNRNSSYESKEGTLFRFEINDPEGSFNERSMAYAVKCVHEQDRDKYLAFVNADTMLASYYRGVRSDVLEYRELTDDNGCRWLRLTVDLVEYPNTTDVEAYMMYENIDEAKKAQLQTKELSENDPLTGLLNRATFTAKVNAILSASKPEAKHALMMLDVDGFKQVNDVFGHGAGDAVLTDIAGKLRSVTRANDLVARLGGDEFVVFLGNITNTSPVIEKAKQIRALCRKAFSMEVQISVSIGIAFSPSDGTDFDTLYKKADSALYYVKGSGKDNQAIYSENMADEHLKPEPDYDDSGKKISEKKRRMLIVDDSSIDHAFLRNIFRDEFILEEAKDGNAALIRLRHYGSAISVVLLDLMMPGIDGFAVLEKMQESAELRSVPVIMVSGDESRETCLTAIRKGATDFVTKPVDVDLLRIRVRSAVSRAENERLRAKNSMLEFQGNEVRRYKAALEHSDIAVIENDLITGSFIYDRTVGEHLAGEYNERGLWDILLSDGVADEQTVTRMRELVRKTVSGSETSVDSIFVDLKTPSGEAHRFRLSVDKGQNEAGVTDRLYLMLAKQND